MQVEYRTKTTRFSLKLRIGEYLVNR